MDNLHNYFFSPLSREYCAYWKYLMYLSFVIFAMTVLTVVSSLLNAGKKGIAFEKHFSRVLQTGLVYFVNRLMYSMCMN